MSFEEALTIQRELARDNPDTYRPKVADTLNNLGGARSTGKHYAQAQVAYEEALANWQEKNPTPTAPVSRKR